MSRIPPDGPQPASPRLRLSGFLIAAGIAVELATLFWNHPVSFFLFVCVGGALMSAGMLVFLWSIVNRSK